MQARFLPPVDVSRGFRAPCRQNFEMLACSCKGRRFQNRCVKCGTMCFPVFTVELILLFFVQTTLFFTCFQKFVRLLCKKVFLVCKLFLFSAFFPIKCCLFRLITALSRFFYFFLLTQSCFYLLSKNLSGCFAKNFFSFVNFSFFRRFSQRTVARFR
ncbi:unknown [Corallococcus sp. CAG:1435]|nr:unknown [Corallococcus sp. CAG:1435]